MMCKIFVVFTLCIFTFSSFFSRGCARSRRVVHETLFACKEIRKNRCFRSEQKSWFFGGFPLRKTIEKVRSSFSAVWAARIAIQVSPFTARRTVRGSSEKMQPREDVRGKNENAEFCSRLPTKCGDGFRGFQSFCKVQTFFALRPAIFRSLKTRDFHGICTPDCF